MLEYAHLLHQVVRVATCNVVALDGVNGDAGSGRALVVALRQLPQQRAPSDVVVPGLLDGLGSVWRLVSKQLSHPHRGPASLEVADAAGAHMGGELASADPVPWPGRHRT